MKESELSGLIVEFFERLSAWEDDAVQGSGLTTAQNHMIEIVGHSGAIKMKDLAAKVGVTTGTLTVAVDRLEKKHLLQRVPHQTDRRSYLIQLTEAGHAVFHKHHALHLELTRTMLDKLTEHEAKDFKHILEKLMDTFHAHN
ncbi:MarR family transcriptional regulator [Pseudodesulfovibrio sp. JC047]|uniref:MarR family winged helix-turn-helix transcriptional regulator n=1 Tax=Pseudodesulfovibrio sp. JC047 TaxID=2683199 RepID=UPI0013D155F9|nr:MarR family transcriptional regulator [Pseudodesulfovibrio sp. JC047]NDV20326.1 MarR family transcriptional regulator [Pseudodesulfovibrio sp. JC047]